MSRNNTIAPQDLNNLRHHLGQLHLIDVRSPAEYRAGHVYGAVSIPLDKLSPEEVHRQLDDAGAGKDTPLFLTCLSGIRAQQAADRLNQAGFDNVHTLEGGTEAWMKAGLPTQRCSGNAISLERQVQIAIGALLVLKVFFGFTVHQLFFAAIPIIGAGLIVAGITRWCGMAQLMAMMPWNQAADCSKKVTV